MRFSLALKRSLGAGTEIATMLPPAVRPATPAAEIPTACSSRSKVTPLRERVSSSSSAWAALPLAVDSSGNRIPVRQLPDPRDLLVHCAQEMNHLAGFLPALHECFGQ
jgi:hypothetical protein